MKYKKAIAGSLLKVDEGEYSDYGVLGFFVVLKSFYPIEELTKFLKENPEQTKNCNFHGSAFLGYLVKMGYLCEINHSTLYLGGYCDHETVHFYD